MAEEAARLLVDGQRVLECADLHCAAGCRPAIGIEDALELLVCATPVRHPKVRDMAVSALESASYPDMQSFLPGLVRALADEPCPKQSSLFHLLVSVAERDRDFFFSLFWALQVSSQDRVSGTVYTTLQGRLLVRLAARLGKERVEEVVDGVELIDVLRRCSSMDTHKQAQEAVLPLLAARQIMSSERSVPLPIDPSFRAATVLTDGMLRMSSKVAPTVFPFLGEQTTLSASSGLETPETPGSMMSSLFVMRPKPVELPTYKLGFKREDVRKDWIIQGIITYMHRCLAKDGIDVPNIAYRVLPTSAGDGLVQWVADCTTLSALKEADKTIHGYIAEFNQHLSTGTLQQTFINSLAASTVITFLLLVGDRHNENMLIHRSGIFFHIDYGYVLGQDPKPLLKTNLALRREMVDAMGGRATTSYLEFRKLSGRIYNSLRKHASVIITMMQVLLHSLPSIDYGTTVNVRALEVELINRFSINMSDEAAEAVLIKCIDGDWQGNAYPCAEDHVHDMGKIPAAVATKVGDYATQAQTLVINAAGNVLNRVSQAYIAWRGRPATSAPPTTTGTSPVTPAATAPKEHGVYRSEQGSPPFEIAESDESNTSALDVTVDTGDASAEEGSEEVSGATDGQADLGANMDGGPEEFYEQGTPSPSHDGAALGDFQPDEALQDDASF